MRKEFISLALIATCAAATAADAQSADYRVTPFSQISEMPAEIKIPPDTYTRLEIVSNHAPAGVIDYVKRKLFWRLTIGKRYTTNVSLKAQANRFIATVPLLTLDHESSSKAGESFTRSNARSSFDFPLFLVAGNGGGDIGTFEFQVNASDGTQSNAASVALSVAERFLKTVAPTSGVMTTLTEDKTREVAGALDTAVNQLFSSSVTERQRFDINLKAGRKYQLEIFGPAVQGDWRDASRRFGSWTIGFAAPRPSVFSDIKICSTGDAPACREDLSTARHDAAADALNRPLSVLAFDLFDSAEDAGSVGAYLRQQSWWAEDLAELDGVTGYAPPVAQFCRQIRSAIVSIGLNDLDARIVAQAVAQSELVPTALGAAMATDDGQAECAVVS